MANAAAGQAMVDLVYGMVREMVDTPEAVEVQMRSDALDGIVLDLKVHASEWGQVIGRQGRTARALRAIVSAARRKHGVECRLNIDSRDGEGSRPWSE